MIVWDGGLQHMVPRVAVIWTGDADAFHLDSSTALRKAANNASYSTDWKCLAVQLIIFEAFTLQLTSL